MKRADELKRAYRLEPHPEGGWFSESYTAPFEKDGRSLAGSIYFLLDAGEISHFHEIDCDEIWYWHEGCGMRLTVLTDAGREELLLGPDPEKGENVMAVIPAGAVFAAENLRSDCYSFVSCVTAPKFDYSGFRLIGRDELRERWPELADETGYLAYPHMDEEALTSSGSHRSL